MKFKPEKRITALTEFGGYSLHITGHSKYDKVYGYKTFKDRSSLSEGYRNLLEHQIIPQIKKGLSVTIYTQVSDIEEEVNGLYTYDREILKIDEEVIKSCNDKCYIE